ncbi:MAG: type II secretion system F family protein [Aquabacterium sp.]
MVIYLALFIALLMMMAAVLSVIRARRMEQIAKVNQRLENLAFLASMDPLRKSANTGMLAAIAKWMRRVGIQMSPGVALVAFMAVTVIGILVYQTWGLLAGLLWWGLFGSVSIIIPQVRYRQKVNKLISQIPLFIDQVIRGLVTGRNVEGAIKLACEDLQEPLKNLIDKAQKNVELGVDLGEAMREAANFYDVKELHMLALAIHTSRVYGGSPREMLESVVNLIRQREQMQRELRALTGETRFSAWVLGGLPTGLGVYMTTINPTQMLSMWHDPSGKNILLTAVSLQITGALLLWRMVKSV